MGTGEIHMALLCKVPVDIPWLIEEARKVDVGLYSLAEFFDEQAPKAGLFMGFGAIATWISTSRWTGWWGF
jgi:GntR family transcriptional regulator/MocR family aminotransferase